MKGRYYGSDPAVDCCRLKLPRSGLRSRRPPDAIIQAKLGVPTPGKRGSGTAGSILECRLQAPVSDWKGAESSQRRERSLGIAYAGASLTAAGQSVGGTRLRGNGLRFQRADAGFP